MPDKVYGSITCFECIDRAAVPEYYRLYVSNGPLTVAYLKRRQQEYFDILRSAPQGFAKYGGTHVLTTSSREIATQTLQSRQSENENLVWEVVRWSETSIPLHVQEYRERQLKQIKESLQGGRYSRCYESSLCMWSEAPWAFFDLEITASHLFLRLENSQGEQETDYILREDGACMHKFLHTYREDGFSMYRELYSHISMS